MVLLVVVVLSLLSASLVRGYVRLAHRRTQVRAAGARIAVPLKRRHDLIPPLVATVEGCAGHERAALEGVLAALQAAVAAAAASPSTRAGAEDSLTRGIGRLFAICAAYPTVTANQSFLLLQSDLARCEDELAPARQVFNNAVQAYNAAVESLPTRLVARATGFRVHEFFEATCDDRAAVGAPL